jgi:APA family basic amino acid/polyamine antiporter
VGWSITAQYLFSSSTVAVGWSGYCVSILKDFGIHLPAALSQAPVLYSTDAGWYFSGAFVNLPAIILVALVGLLIAVGIRAASAFNNVMVVIKLTTIALFVILGLSFIHMENWTPFIPENTGVFGHYGWSGIFRAAGLVFFAYIGFDTVSTLAQESINPQKDLPRGILGSLLICTLAYIVTALVLTGVVHFKLLNVPDPMSVALDAMGGFAWLKFLVKFAILAGLASVVLVQLLAQTRIFYAISRDGLLPRKFSHINHKTRTPLFSTIVTHAASIVFSGLFPVAILGELVSMTTLFLFANVCLGVLLLRYSHPHMKRPFKVPFVPWIPIAGITACLFQMSFLPMITWIQLVSWLAVGLVIYFAYSIHHSKIRKELERLPK